MSRVPQRVYWFRRLLVLVVVIVGVFVASRLLPGSSPTNTAAQTPEATVDAAPPAPTPGAPRPHQQRRAGAHHGTRHEDGRKRNARHQSPPPPAEPDGECAPSDITIAPSVADTYRVGDSPDIRLLLQTTGRPACTFQPSRSNLVVEVTDDNGVIWTTDHCHAAIALSTLVIRAAEQTVYHVPWSGLRSNRWCGDGARRAVAGTYQVLAAVLGGEPSQSQFSLAEPRPKHHHRHQPR